MPSQAQSDQTQVRFLHAVAGAGPASLVVEKGGPRLPSAFAKPSGYQVFRPGQTRLRLILNGQSSPVASEIVRLGPGKHTVVAVGGDNGVDLLVYQDDGVEAGKATLRAIHVASEVGRADVRVDGKVVASDVGLGDATGYLAVPPGRHSVAVTRPGGEGGPLVKAQVRAVAGTAASGFVVGSAGMPAQIVLTEDGTAGPVTAPATGLGGATSGGAWLLILGSSLIGGSLGGASFLLARRTRSRGSLQVATPAGSAGPPSLSSVAAGPPVVEPKEAEAVEEAPATVEAPVKSTPPPLPPLPPMPALPPLPTAPVAPAPLELAAAGAPEVGAPANGFHADAGANGTALESTTNGHAPDEPADAAEVPPAPALWTPPPGERWTAPRPTGRFARTEAEATPAAPAPPSYPRFIRPDPEPAPVAESVPAADAVPAAEATAAEPAIPAPTPLLFTSPPVDSPAPDAPRPLSPWPEGPAPQPYPPVPAASPEPVAPEVDEPWTGSWIAEPVEETVVEPTEVIEAPTPDVVAEETITDAVEVPEEPEAAVETGASEPAESTPDELVPVAAKTWSSTSSRPGSATGADRPHKVNFLVVSGAALVVTGLIAARRGGRH